MATGKLNDAVIKAAKPAERVRKLSDGNGLQLWIMPTGGKLWRLAYRYGGKQKTLALGSYPVVRLADARIRAEEHRKVLADQRDPSVVRRQADDNTFDSMADAYLQKLEREGAALSTRDKNAWLLSFARPVIGSRPISKIATVEVHPIIEALQDRGRRESARRARAVIGAVFRFAIGKGLAENDPTIALQRQFKAPEVKHRAALTEAKPFGALLRAIDDFDGQPTTKAALLLCAMLAPRPGEIRQAEWSEFDLEAKVWVVPAGRMKMRRPHASPLSVQAVAILADLRKMSGTGKLLFPSIRSKDRPISDGTLNAALRRLGFTKDDATAHGFRASFSSLANESGKWHPDAIERQLAHTDDDAIRGAYNRSPFWAERVKMMEWWGDEIDRMREGGKVSQLREPA